jgi:glycosyltransferase involved in cell wall biosynthesis
MISPVLTLIALIIGIPAFALLTMTLAAIIHKFSYSPMHHATDAGLNTLNPQHAFQSAATTLQRPLAPSSTLRLAILIPAHNESYHLVPTLRNLLAQCRQHDRLIVIADNCCDDTAFQANQAGAIVLERHSELERGKGYALAFGVDYLRDDPPDVVVIIDADCFVSDGAISALAHRCQETRRPVQIPSLMQGTVGASTTIRIMEFAMLMKNFVRPLGSSRLGKVCHLMGTGMALPWVLISTAQLATPSIVEDMVLGVDLASLGYPAVFLPGFIVSSHFMNNPNVVRLQKKRWEHGYLHIMLVKLPTMIGAAWRRRDLSLAVLALDLSIPPISLYFLILCGLLFCAGFGAWLTPALSVVLWILLSTTCCFVFAILLGWWFFGRHILTVTDLLWAPLYAIWKLPIYIAFLLKKRAHWNRTDRVDK